MDKTDFKIALVLASIVITIIFSCTLASYISNNHAYKMKVLEIESREIILKDIKNNICPLCKLKLERDKI